MSDKDTKQNATKGPGFRHRTSPLYAAALDYHARVSKIGERLAADERRQLVNAARTLVVRIAAVLEVGERQDAPAALDAALRSASACSARLDCCANYEPLRAVYDDLRERLDAIGGDLELRRIEAVRETRGRGPVQEDLERKVDAEQLPASSVEGGREGAASTGQLATAVRALLGAADATSGEAKQKNGAKRVSGTVRTRPG